MQVSSAWRALMEGRARSVAAVARDVGWSRQHLSTEVTHELGLGPKRFQRLMRFNRAAGLARESKGASWSEIALRCGYYDQAHLVREFNEFAGYSPTRFVKALLPADGGIADG